MAMPSSPDHGSPEVGRLDDAETRMVRDPLKVKEASDDVSFRSRACVRQSPPSEAAGLDGRTWRFR
jgi:hypothetical protein